MGTSIEVNTSLTHTHACFFGGRDNLNIIIINHIDRLGCFWRGGFFASWRIFFGTPARWPRTTLTWA
jgi:hypothetical protein